MYKTKDDYVQEWIKQFDLYFFKLKKGRTFAGINHIYLHDRWMDLHTFLYYKNEKYQKVWHYFDSERH